MFALDQYIKFLFVNGYEHQGYCISLVLVYNKGIAFSMFAFLQHWLKYIQLFLICGGFVYLLFHKDIFLRYYLALSFLFAGGISNIFDRFNHIGVVDYIYWHCGFDFAIFNFADVLIDVSIGLILLMNYMGNKAQSLKLKA